MSRTRDLGKIISGNFDVPATALDNAATAVNTNVSTLAVTRSNISDLGTGALSNRNMIINGNFAIWQRGTSFSSSGYGADRWSYGTSGGAGVHSRQAFTGSDIDTFGTQYFHRLAVSTGANNQGMSTLLEDLSRFAGKTVTLSFYAKGTNPAGGHLTTLIGGETGSGGSGDWEVGGTNEIVLSSSWQKFTVTITLPSMNGRTLGTGSYLFIYLARQPNDDNTTNAWTIDMSQVQLELGDTATPFEHRSHGEELAKCQRYFYAINGFGHPSPTAGPYQRWRGTAQNANEFNWYPQYPVPMRATPSFSGVNLSGSTIQMFNETSQEGRTFGSFASAEGGVSEGQVRVLSTNNIPVGHQGSWRFNASPNASIFFDAEL
jgi:hypothetical protein